MTTANRAEAQQRSDDIRVFNIELQRLEREDVLQLDAAQRGAIDQHHKNLLEQFATAFDIDVNPQARQLSLGMRIVSFLGALALAASVFFLFYQFWGWFTAISQIAILISATVLTFLATAWIKRFDGSGYFAKLAAMVAFSCFVLNLVMLGQIFNITPSDKALLPWAALAFLLAYTYDLRLLLVAGQLCLIAFVAARVGTWGGMYWLDLGSRPENFFPAGIALFVLPLLIAQRRFAGFAMTYRVVGLLALFLPMLVLANSGTSSYLPFDPNVIEGTYQLLGFAGTALAVWIGVRRHWNEVVNTGVAMFVIFLYTKLFDWWWDVMPKYLFFFVLGLVALLLLFVFRRFRVAGVMQTSAGGRQ
jgi:uncharacterized membrane protein